MPKDIVTAISTEQQRSQGWYQDPWGTYGWRWWDGVAWTAHVSLSTSSEPKLPNWLSTPVIVCSFLSVPLTFVYLFLNPLAVGFAFTPLALLFPGLWWLNRVEPQPWSSRVHAALWGALVATLISGFINTIVAIIGGETLAAIASAPIVEEASKGMALVWALRRKEIDGVMDGVIYACWVALGFAVVENITYLASAPDLGTLLQTVLLRGVLSPFAHPLFTFWIGLAIGLSVRWRQSVLAHLLWGYPLAVVGHAAWNGTISYATEIDREEILFFAYGGFLALFVAVIVGLILIRRNQQNVFVEQMPLIASRYQISETEVEVFGNWRSLLANRKTLSHRQKANFDRLHATLAKLALAHGGPAKVTRAREELLASQLGLARSKAFSAEVR